MDEQDDAPIFVRGMSRSGGTLMVTILDAHPDVAMSYELYPELLELEDPGPPALRRLADQFEQADTMKAAIKAIEDKSLRTFVVRSQRGGLDHEVLARLLREHAEREGFETEAARLRFVERCCRAKMESVGKRRWGLKCTQAFPAYLAIWPQAYFLNMLRDGRDVLASQQNTGAFKGTPEAIGRGWTTTHTKFRRLVGNPEVNAFEVRYERLVRDPEAEVRAICEFLRLKYVPSMLAYHAEDLTVFSASHLSMDRITKPVDDSKVGRWRTDLSAESLDSFMASAGVAMRELGYDDEQRPC